MIRQQREQEILRKLIKVFVEDLLVAEVGCRDRVVVWSGVVAGGQFRW